MLESTEVLDAPEPRARRGKEHWLLLAATIPVAAGLAFLGLFVQPDPSGAGTHTKLGMRPCLPMEHWDFPCPGCGVTTSVTHAMRGELWTAFANQPFGLLVALLFVAFLVWAPIAHLRGRDLFQDVQRLTVGRTVRFLGWSMALAWIYKILLVRGAL